MSELRLPHRPLGRTGLRVSALGLSGSFGLPARGVERAFHDHAINYFFLRPRLNERPFLDGLRGLVRAGHRDRLVLAAGTDIPTAMHVRWAWRRHTRALGVDTIDIWHMYWVQAERHLDAKVWDAMRRLRDEGKVKALAISCHKRDLARTLLERLDLDVLMLRYNAAHRGAEQEIFPVLGAPRPGIVVYTATRWGKLLEPLDGDPPMTAPECYRFALGPKEVDVALFGPANLDELRQDVAGVLRGPLDEARLAAVRRFGDRVRLRVKDTPGLLTGLSRNEWSRMDARDQNVSAPAVRRPAAVSARGLVKYYGTRPSLRGVDLDIAAGEVAGIVGMNGAGKSTLLRLLAGFMVPTRGSIELDGRPLDRSPSVQRCIGFAPERPALYVDSTVREHLLFVARMRGGSAAEAAAWVDEAAARTGLVDVRDQLIGELSHGFRKRVGLAQAIVHRPQLLILDEPSSGLDPVQQARMRDLVADLRREHTIVMSSHDLDEIRQLCDRVIVIHRGSIASTGPVPDRSDGPGDPLARLLVDLDRAEHVHS